MNVNTNKVKDSTFGKYVYSIWLHSFMFVYIHIMKEFSFTIEDTDDSPFILAARPVYL
jgi:hypothetical protein